MQGVVRWFNSSKGYGFIRMSDGSDCFVHYRNIAGEGFRELHENDHVEFNVQTTAKGLSAVNVRVLPTE